jgi:peroxiredoxin
MMIDKREQAPSFELPAVVGGRPARVSLDDVLGESIVVLAFYPADFNPSCTDRSTDLDEFDVFRMQSDAAILAVSGDSIYSHRAFAKSHDLHLPLLADIRGEVAAAYGVESGDTRYPTQRAVVVIDLEGRVTYTWVADNIEERPDIDAVQQAFAAVGDAEFAKTQYREACTRYSEGRDAFVEGMRAYRNRDWVLASGEFETAAETLEVARDGFRRSARFSEDEAVTPSFERGLRVAEELDRAVDLLGDAAGAHASGDGQRGRTLRGEAEDVVERLRELGPPPDPDDLPADLGDTATTGEGLSILDAASGRSEADVPVAATDPGAAVDNQSQSENGDIDEEELEALTAEIETQELSNGDSG